MTDADIHVVLKTGGEFTLAHATRIYEQLINSRAIGYKCSRSMVLHTDSREKLPETHFMKFNHRPLSPKWWGKIDAMRDCPLEGMWLVDLDTTVFEFPAQPDRTTFNKDFYNQGRYGSGFCYLTQEDAGLVYREYLSQGPDVVQKAFSGKTPETLGDQAFIHSVLGDRSTFPVSQVCSYKKHIRPSVSAPMDVQVVCFHGNPRPWAIPELSRVRSRSPFRP